MVGGFIGYYSDYQLLLGSEICTEIRNLVFAELSYTCSAGTINFMF